VRGDLGQNGPNLKFLSLIALKWHVMKSFGKKKRNQMAYFWIRRVPRGKICERGGCLRIRRWNFAVNQFYLEKMFGLGSLSCYTSLRKNGVNAARVSYFFFFNEGWGKMIFSEILQAEHWNRNARLSGRSPMGLPSTFLQCCCVVCFFDAAWSEDADCWRFTRWMQYVKPVSDLLQTHSC